MKKYLFIIVSLFLLVGCGSSNYNQKTYYKPKTNPQKVFWDSRTGLMWQDNTRPPYYSVGFNSANKYCESMKLAGHEDWRLPSIVELVTLIDYNKNSRRMSFKRYKSSSTTMIISDFYGLYGLPTSMSYLLSSTVNNDGDALKLSYLSGTIASEKKTQKKRSRVICVRGEKKPLYIRGKKF